MLPFASPDCLEVLFMSKKTFYITTAIDYPNAPPHIGHAYEKIIADMIARWHMLKGEDVYYLVGTDEHGQKIEKTAKAANKKPQQFVDDMAAKFEALCQALNLSYDSFIRTTDKKHVKTATEIFGAVFDKGLIYKGKYTGLYCYGCEAFYTEYELDDGKCPTHKRRAEQLSEESYFFKLSAFQERLLEHINKHPDFIQPESKRNEILSRLREPLRDLSVTRTSISWGIAAPCDTKHVIYVWFDALLNYLSGVAYPTSKYEKYWPPQCQLIGKDIAWFHTVIWPAILMAADLPLPKTVYSHGFLTVDGHKMSKSIGNVVDPLAVIEDYGVDPLRYLLLRDVVAGEDGDFSERALVQKNNADLADALGNLLQRTSTLVHKHFGGTIPTCHALTRLEEDLNMHIPNTSELSALMDEYKWHQVVQKIWNYIHYCNKYINDAQPWKVADKDRLATILYTVVEHLRIIGILVWPIIPASAEKLCAQLGLPRGKLKDATFTTKTSGKLSPPQVLFKKFDIPAREDDPFSKLNLKVARITSVEQHPNADKLYVLALDLGEERRQIVAGMKLFYAPGELEGKHVVIVTNLKPAKLRGVESQGMMLAAEHGDTVRVLEAPDSVPGDQVVAQGIAPKTARITIDDFASIELIIQDGRAVYDSKPLHTPHGFIVADMPDGSTIR